MADEIWYRATTGVLGAFVGSLVSLALGLPLMYFAHARVNVGGAALAGVIAGAALGTVLPGTLIYAIQAVLYFVFGIFGAMAGGMDPPAFTPRWLLAAFLFGGIYFLALAYL